MCKCANEVSAFFVYLVRKILDNFAVYKQIILLTTLIYGTERMLHAAPP
jgi:hypothetical protein